MKRILGQLELGFRVAFRHSFGATHLGVPTAQPCHCRSLNSETQFLKAPRNKFHLLVLKRCGSFPSISVGKDYKPIRKAIFGITHCFNVSGRVREF